MFDEKEFALKVEKCQFWEAKATKISKDIIKKCKSVNFLRETEYESQLFGKLIFFMPDDFVYDLSVILLKMNHCVQSDQYLNEIFRENDTNSSSSTSESSNTDDITLKSYHKR